MTGSGRKVGYIRKVLNNALLAKGLRGAKKAKDKKEEFMSQVLSQLNELFITENLTDKDMLNYAFVVYDKLAENNIVMTQLDNNIREQAMLGDFPKAIDDAVMDSNDAHREMMMQYLSSPEVAKGIAHLMYDIAKMRREMTHE